MEQITEQIINNFNFAYMIVINLITYFIIKFIDYINKNKHVSILIKRCTLVIITIISFIVYNSFTDIETIILINSSVLAPVFWSWILKPIMKKFKLNYKSINDIIN